MSTMRLALRGLRDLQLGSKTPSSLAPACSVLSRATTTTPPAPSLGLARRTISTTPSNKAEGLISYERSETQVAHPHARPKPASPSYFARFTNFYDSYVQIQELYLKYRHLPVVPAADARRVAWRGKAEYRLVIGEHIKGRDFSACMAIVKRLNLIHPDLMPQEVIDGLQPFTRDINFHEKIEREIPVDKFGRTMGVGRRKTSTARAWVVEGTGEVLINGKPVNEAFGRLHDRESALWALKSTERMDKYNVWARVEGGGSTGQAEALAMAIAYAITGHEPALKTRLRKAGCITRDYRAVERKKAGHLKARKMTPWQPR
ncbi:ribosomal protein S5 domain 2-type protein [Microdochium trichocladiopsis]|uniref:Small ribosomal subunit protein uS9m n=1 Tax=Microdochium trichocladiopsis TaxID=1682393 RepID=A0A9P9BRI0_9PEZI|nr:ribosomal protein S5 domain 2-type protein [Microdochium trichocladiopsis]KAH7032936.1 ribosomal protein S5 domain 2-type protein [Microdochium trichocladiopsis]